MTVYKLVLMEIFYTQIILIILPQLKLKNYEHFAYLFAFLLTFIHKRTHNLVLLLQDVRITDKFRRIFNKTIYLCDVCRLIFDRLYPECISDCF